MDIETNIFKKYQVDNNKLLHYGFKKIDNDYIYETVAMDMMQFIITINDGLVKGKIIDLNTNFEYTNYRLDSIMGSFAFGVREEYEKILKDIRDKCFSKKYFVLDQSNRLTMLINNKYHVLPEFLWEDSPNAGVFRNKRSNKWFALIMNIAYEKIDNKHKGNIDVVNIKLDNEVGAYLNVKGIYPAYHMNKKSWITIVLDDTLSDDYILKLIDKSYKLNSILGAWLIPANPNYYDIVNAFNNNDTINWKQSNNILKDDIIFLYVGSPYSCIMYKCVVIDANIPYKYQDKNLKIDKMMEIKLLKRYNYNDFTFDKLKKEYGINAIRGPRGISQELFEILNK